MKRIIILIATILLSLNCANYAQNEYILRGRIKNINMGNVELSYQICNNNKWDDIKKVAEIIDGKFVIKGFIDEPIDAILKINDIETVLYMEPTKMDFFLDTAHPENYTLKGSKTQNDCLYLNNELKKYVKISNDINDSINFYKDLFSSLDDSTIVLKKIEPFNKQQKTNDYTRAKIIKEFTLTHKDSYEPILSNTLFFLMTREYLSVDSARIIFDNLDEKIKSYCVSIEFNTYLKSKENTQDGKFAPDFRTKDVNDKLVALSDYKGQYILLDFWASWCTWCIKGIPHIKELKEKYQNKGFEVIGVTLDRSKDDWMKAIEKYKISDWVQIKDVQDIEKAKQHYINYEDIKQKYPLRDGIPLYILIDKEGKIIKKWNGYSEENEKEMDEVMKGIFKY